MATSKDVAAYFEKRHEVVLRAISNLIAVEPSIAHKIVAIELAVKAGFGTRWDRAFEMDRDGFTLLAMGFTGKKALQFKLA